MTKRRDRVEPQPVAPGPEHRRVIAQQQQEHGGRGQQHAGQGLHPHRDQAERGMRYEDDAAATATKPAKLA